MDILEDQHFKNYKFLMSCYGVWPYQPRYQKYLLRCVATIGIFSILTPKTIKFIEYLGDLDNMIQCIPMICVHLLGLVKFANWIFNANAIKRLFVLMERDGKTLKSEEDKEIMQRWLIRTRKLTSAYTAAMFPILGLFLASPALPKILDFIKPLNQTRDLIYLYETEYFVDQREYYLPILLHYYLSVPISVGGIVFFDNMLGTFIHHECAMLEILSLYLQRVNAGSHAKKNHGKEKLDIIRQKIVHCVHMHQHSMEFALQLDSSIHIAYFIVLGLSLLVLTVTGMTTVIKLDQTNEALNYGAFTMGSIFHLFYSSFQGQILITQSEKVFYSVYTCDWYNLPNYHQKLLNIILLKSVKPFTVSAGKLYVLSMDTFSIVLKNAMSFFTVLSSMR
ncbi:odorant receptor 13a-like [Cotesia glomerata]|nr:odorant receptor 13a-like [Cotesia glomerata]